MKTVLLAGAMVALFATSAHAGIFDGIVAGNNDRIKMATSEALGSQVALEDIKILEVKHGFTTVKWRAQTPSGTYACMNDDMMRGRPACAKEKDAVADASK